MAINENNYKDTLNETEFKEELKLFLSYDKEIRAIMAKTYNLIFNEKRKEVSFRRYFNNLVDMHNSYDEVIIGENEFKEFFKIERTLKYWENHQVVVMDLESASYKRLARKLINDTDYIGAAVDYFDSRYNVSKTIMQEINEL